MRRTKLLAAGLFNHKSLAEELAIFKEY
jgi:hypothetical protein